jgi:hypothetical protein
VSPFDRNDTRTSFIDMLLSGQMNLFVVFIMALLLVNPVTKKAGDVDLKAEYTIDVQWKDAAKCDVDTWVRTPTNDVIWWQAKDRNGVHLERDDIGTANDVNVVDNSERVVVRGSAAGEYVVNVHLYSTQGGTDCLPMPVVVKLVKLNPVSYDVITKSVVLNRKGDEAHAFRFKVDANQVRPRTWDEPVSLVGQFLSKIENDRNGAGQQ